MSEQIPESVERTHHYHASATVIAGHLKLPLAREIRPQAHSALQKEGGYFSEHAEGFTVEGVISFRSAYTQVAGNKSNKDGRGWTTISTTAIEGLNVLEVVTADRVVTQIITEHPLVGYVPSINLLGTRFENLRIAGHPVDLDLDHNILGAKPDGDATYTKDSGLITRVGSQYSRVLESDSLPEDLRERYNRLSSTLGSAEAVECSLVNRASGSYPGHSFGHIIYVPDFGKIVLAKLIVSHGKHDTPTGAPRITNVHLTMVDLELGCAVEGSVPIGSGSSNGTTIP
ncbi:MAG TPA: hypothetical protein VME23_04330 [Terracidiphilus sp.]|nr:hypothetical protein [Terracidiphilus sp.]